MGYYSNLSIEISLYIYDYSYTLEDRLNELYSRREELSLTYDIDYVYSICREDIDKVLPEDIERIKDVEYAIESVKNAINDYNNIEVLEDYSEQMLDSICFYKDAA